MDRIFKIGKHYIMVGISRKNTCWWDQVTKHRCRVDKLIGIDRVYYRNYRVYIYRFHLGRLKLSFIKDNV